MRRTVLNWSGGKDSVMSLHRLADGQEYEVTALLTTVVDEEDRVLTHGLRTSLLHKQAKALDIPLHIVRVPEGAGGAAYGAPHERELKRLLDQGVVSAAFGDIHLQDVREYREKNLARLGMRGIFPLWQNDSADLMNELIDLGYRCVVVSVDTGRMPEGFLGREVDASFLSELPAGVDPAGENGEFHTFVFDGPVFRHPLEWSAGPIIRHDHFAYLDLELPPDEEGPR